MDKRIVAFRAVLLGAALAVVMSVGLYGSKTYSTSDGGPIPLCGPNCNFQWGHCWCTF